MKATLVGLLAGSAAAYDCSRLNACGRIVGQRVMRPARAAVAMAEVTEIMMPALSSTMTEGKISQWLMTEGDKVEVGDMVLVVESDKADMDVESYEEGFIAKILVPEGESAAVGAPVALLVADEADISEVAAV